MLIYISSGIQLCCPSALQKHASGITACSANTNGRGYKKHGQVEHEESQLKRRLTCCELIDEDSSGDVLQRVGPVDPEERADKGVSYSAQDSTP